jgi:hypothetical protein
VVFEGRTTFCHFLLLCSHLPCPSLGNSPILSSDRICRNIQQSGQERWNIRFAQTGFTIRAGKEYLIRLKVQAAGRIMFGV